MFVPARHPNSSLTLYRVGCDAGGCDAVIVDEDPEEATDLVTVPLPGQMPWHLMGEAQEEGAWAVGARWRTLCPAHAPALYTQWSEAAAEMTPLWGSAEPAPRHTARLWAGTRACPGWEPVHAARTTPTGWEVACGTSLHRAARTEHVDDDAPVTCDDCILALALHLNPPPADTLGDLYRLAAGYEGRTRLVDTTDLSPAMLTTAVTHHVLIPLGGEATGRYSLSWEAIAWAGPHTAALAPWATSWEPTAAVRAA